MGGAHKILAIYRRNNTGRYAPGRSAVENLFRRAGYTGARRRRNLGEAVRLQTRVRAEKPDEVWTVNFKG
ncbi:MAG: hypothetical protein LBS06_02500 [Treponema sp.]|nr:hypothetical protein [Treponema sp.]